MGMLKDAWKTPGRRLEDIVKTWKMLSFLIGNKETIYFS